jgi:hypothetical protein
MNEPAVLKFMDWTWRRAKEKYLKKSNVTYAKKTIPNPHS